MKKFTILIAALLIVAMGFAQTKQLTKPTFKASQNSVAFKSTRAVTGTLQLSGTEEYTGIGTGGAGTFAAAARFEASALTSYVGQYITKISVDIHDASTVTAGKVAILTGTIDAPVVATEQACTFVTGINEVTLLIPYQIPTGTAIMVAYEVTVTSGYPIVCDEGPVVEGANLINMEGITGAFSPLTDLSASLTYNFIIAATVEDEISTDPVMMVSPSEMSFVGFVGDANTAAQTATIIAANLTGDITVTTAAPFEVSADNTAFGATATMTEGGNFYVRYIPANAEALNVTGTVTIATAGVDNQTIALTAITYDCTAAITSFPYEEGFENGIPQCWTLIDADGDGHNWMAITDLISSDASEYVHGGANAAISESYDNNTGALNTENWMITKAIAIPATETLTAKWYARSLDGNYPDTYSVYIGTAPTVAAMAGPVLTHIARDWTEKSIDLTSYQGQTVYIGFKHQDSDEYVIMIDDFSVVRTISNDITITDVTFGTPSNCSMGSNTVIVTVKNEGTDIVNTFTLSYAVNGQSPVSATINNAYIYPGETYEYTFSQAIPVNAVGEYNVVVTATLAGDDNLEGNEKQASFEKMVPEIELTAIAPYDGQDIRLGEPINIQGLVTNNSCELTSYLVTYKVNNGEFVANYTVECNVAEGETHIFTHNIPFEPEVAGEYTITVKVSMPNGTADDAEDNEMTATINVIICNPITTFPYVEDFENGVNACWTSIDADGDGYNWMHSSARFDSFTGNSGTGAILSESYRGSALTPDNWAITPALSLPENSTVELSFYAAAQDASWAGEHYGVYVSTTTTDPSAFTLLWEETMNSSGGSHAKAQGTWGAKHTDLSDYAGQTVYIGFRHFNCTDMFILLIDDITVNVTALYTIDAIPANSNMGTVSGGGTYQEGTSVTLTATPNSGYRFVSWNDGNTDNPRTITVTGNATYIATFEAIPTYTITAQSLDENMGTVTGGGTYVEGTTVTLTAIPNNGYRFVSWYDGNTDNPRTITVTESATYIATFEALPYTITVLSSNETYGTVTGGGEYTFGSQATIEASPNEGYLFRSWNDDNTDNPRTITVTGDATYIASFEAIPTYTITVLSVNPSYGTVTGGGTYPEGSTITIQANANDGYVFTSWNDDNTENPRTITVTSDATYIANFSDISSVTTYTITVLSANNELGEATGSGVYAEGSVITIEAIPYEGYRFASWNDNNTNNPRQITVTGDSTYIASFEELPAQYTITVLSANDDQGTVAGGGTFEDGSEIQISATANEGFRFVSWNDGNTDSPRTITVTGDSTFIASFEALPQQYTITVLSANNDQGSVAGGGTFEEGTEIQISATASEGFRFVSWNDGNTENPRTITVTGAATYIASFEALPQQYTITVISASDDQGTVDGGGTFDEGTEIQISATASEGFRFVSWNDGNTDNPRTITVSGDATYIASFEALPQQYTITVISASDVQGTVAGGGTFDEGTEIQISATANEGYAFASWNDGNTDNPRTITVTGDATYIASFIPATGIEENIALEIDLFPNPTTDILNITATEEISEIEIVNVMGQVVMRMEVNSDNAVCDVEGLKAGMYFVRIYGTDATSTIAQRKFVKE